MDRNIIMMPGSNYNEHLENQYNCFGGTQNIYNQQKEEPVETETTCEMPTATPMEEEAHPQSSLSKDDLLKAAIQMFAPKCNRSRIYKWGLAYQALIRKGLIDAIGPTEFGRLVEQITGIPQGTVRHDSEFFEYKEKYKNTIDSMVAMIENLSNM